MRTRFNVLAYLDMKLLVEIIKWVQKVVQTEPLKSVTTRGVNLPLNATDAEISTFIAGAGDSEGHISGKPLATYVNAV